MENSNNHYHHSEFDFHTRIQNIKCDLVMNVYSQQPILDFSINSKYFVVQSLYNKTHYNVN